jgi:rubrerythrin
MTYKKGKQQFTKEEIIEILRRNVNLFKDEDEFVDYIVELALYLVEHRMQTQTEASDTHGPARADEKEEVFEKRQEPFQKGSFWNHVSDVRDFLERQVRDASEPMTVCRICGASVSSKAKICPICGSML